MIKEIFNIIFILNAFLFAYPKSVHSEQERGFQVEHTQSSASTAERDFRAFRNTINKHKFKKLTVSDAFLTHPGYNFSIFTDNFQVVPASFTDESNYAAMPKELNFNIGYNFSPYLGITGGFKRSVVDYNREYTGWLSLEKKFEYKYYGTSLSVLGITPPFKGFSLYGGLGIQRVVIEPKDIVAENIIGLYFSKAVGVAFKPKPWFSLFLGYNTETVDVKIIDTIFSGQFGVNMIEGLSLGFNMDF